MNIPIQRFITGTRVITGTLVLGFALSPLPAMAKSGDPVAIRHLPGGGFAIESMWNMSVVVSVDQFETDQRSGVDVTFSGVDADEIDQGNDRFLVKTNAENRVDYVLDRPANRGKAVWKPYTGSTALSPNAIRVRTLGSANLVVVDVDGLRISCRHAADKSEPLEQQVRDVVDGTDVMILTSSGSTADLSKNVEPGSNLLNPRIVIMGTKSDRAAVGNTVAVAAVDPSDNVDRKTIVLSSAAVDGLPEELSALMEKKETACEASQKVFAALSVNQMNFRPGNGSHTPRWNAEHMMGRELLFFSQIFHALDPTIPVMDLNPKQMPPDYVARHADWTGQEEARQMQRVSAFTRRYAYLIKDLPLDEKAPGSSWTPRGLLRQMERHYNEHTANVKKKFSLDGWPHD